MYTTKEIPEIEEELQEEINEQEKEEDSEQISSDEEERLRELSELNEEVDTVMKKFLVYPSRA